MTAAQSTLFDVTPSAGRPRGRGATERVERTVDLRHPSPTGIKRVTFSFRALKDWHESEIKDAGRLLVYYAEQVGGVAKFKDAHVRRCIEVLRDVTDLAAAHNVTPFELVAWGIETKGAHIRNHGVQWIPKPGSFWEQGVYKWIGQSAPFVRLIGDKERVRKQQQHIERMIERRRISAQAASNARRPIRWRTSQATEGVSPVDEQPTFTDPKRRALEDEARVASERIRWAESIHRMLSPERHKALLKGVRIAFEEELMAAGVVGLAMHHTRWDAALFVRQADEALRRYADVADEARRQGLLDEER